MAFWLILAHLLIKIHCHCQINSYIYVYSNQLIYDSKWASGQIMTKLFWGVAEILDSEDERD